MIYLTGILVSIPVVILVFLVVLGRLNLLCFILGHDMVEISYRNYMINSRRFFWVRCSRRYCKYLKAVKENVG